MDIPSKISKSRLKQFSREHLYYEISMLYGTMDILLKEPKDPIVHNGLLESLVLHVSTMMDFFYKPLIKEDDVRAVQYVRDVKVWKAALPPMSKQFQIFVKKRNKEVAHLSFKRMDLKPEQKRWDSPKLVKQMRKIIDLFLDHADPGCMDRSLFELRSPR